MNIITFLPKLIPRLKTVKDYVDYETCAWSGTPFLRDCVAIKTHRLGEYSDTNFVHLYRDEIQNVFIVLSIFVGSCQECIDTYALRQNIFDKDELNFLECKRDEEQECEVLICNKLLRHSLSKASVHMSLNEALSEFNRISTNSTIND